MSLLPSAADEKKKRSGHFGFKEISNGEKPRFSFL
jgi:hypothetical protein